MADATTAFTTTPLSHAIISQNLPPLLITITTVFGVLWITRVIAAAASNSSMFSCKNGHPAVGRPSLSSPTDHNRDTHQERLGKH